MFWATIRKYSRYFFTWCQIRWFELYLRKVFCLIKVSKNYRKSSFVVKLWDTSLHIYAFSLHFLTTYRNYFFQRHFKIILPKRPSGFDHSYIQELQTKSSVTCILPVKLQFIYAKIWHLTIFEYGFCQINKLTSLFLIKLSHRK